MNGLKAFRADFKLTQQEVADAMGLPFRTYQDVENCVTDWRPIHERAMERASLVLALKYKRPMIALAPVRRDVLDFVSIVRGEPIGERPNPE